MAKKQTRTTTPEARQAKIDKQKATIQRKKAEKLAAETQSNNSENTPIVEENNTVEKKTEEVKVDTNANDIIAKQAAFIEKQNEINERLLKSIEELKNAPQSQAPVQTFIQRPDDNQKKKFGTSLRKEIEPSDRLTLPATFVAIGGLFPMNVYMKNGSEVYAPLDKEIVFKPNFSAKKRMSDGTEKDCWYSLFSTTSKKECEYIRNSPDFGNFIFDNQSAAIDVNYELVDKIKTATVIVNKLSDIQLMQEAATYHISTDGVSADQIRDDLKNIKVSEIMETESSETQRRIQRLKVHETVNNGE